MSHQCRCPNNRVTAVTAPHPGSAPAQRQPARAASYQRDEVDARRQGCRASTSLCGTRSRILGPRHQSLAGKRSSDVSGGTGLSRRVAGDLHLDPLPLHGTWAAALTPPAAARRMAGRCRTRVALARDSRTKRTAAPAVRLPGPRRPRKIGNAYLDESVGPSARFKLGALDADLSPTPTPGPDLA